MKPDSNLLYYLVGIIIGAYFVPSEKWFTPIFTVAACGISLVTIYLLRYRLSRPICWLRGHQSIPMVDCDNKVFAKACERCGRVI